MTVLEFCALAKYARSLPRGADDSMAREASSARLWESLLQTPAYNARDRLEFILALQKLLLDRHGPGSASPLTSEDDGPIKTHGRWLERDIANLRSQIVDETHPMLAVRYAALAQLPGATIGRSHRRARNLREVERSRVLLSAEELRGVESAIERRQMDRTATLETN